MKVKGILVEGNDGHSYLLGIGDRPEGAQKHRPTIWRLTDGTCSPLEDIRAATPTIREHLGLQVQPQVGANHDEHVKQATIEALTEFITTFFANVRW